MSKRRSGKQKKERREKREARKREQRKKTGRSWIRTAWPFLGRAQRARSHSAMPVALTLDSSELWGEKPTWEAVRERLSMYSLGQIMDLVGRMGAVLYHAYEDGTDPEPQLIHAFLGDRAPRVWGRIVQARARQARKEIPTTIQVFQPAALLTALKTACAILPPEVEGGHDQLQPLGEALLMINGLIEVKQLSNVAVDPTSPEGRRYWVYYTFVNAAFHRQGHILHELVRAYQLYQTDRPHLMGTPAYVDLPALVRNATGLDPETLWAILFAFIGHFYSITPDNAHSTGAWIHRTFYFRNYGFAPEEIERFYSLLGRDMETVRQELAIISAPSQLGIFDPLPLVKSPLVLQGDQAFAPFLPALINALTSGMHYRLLDAGTSATERSRFQTYMGDVFEDHVDQLFRRVFDGAKTASPRYVGPQELRQALPGTPGKEPSVCDGLIIYADAVFLVEVKAKLLTAAARAGLDENGFYTKLSEILDGGAQQIRATIDHIRAGHLQSLGIGPASATTCYPLIVTLEPLVMSPHAYSWVRDNLTVVRSLNQSGVNPLQVLDIGECEMLEMALLEGQNLRSIFDMKLAQPGSEAASYNNFAIQTGIGWPQARHNSTLAREFERLTNAALDFFRTRQVAQVETTQ